MSDPDQHAERIRAALDGVVDGQVREQKMFGSVCWMIDGNMAVCSWGEDQLLVRVGPDGMTDALAQPHTEIVQMGERTMGGFVVVTADGIESDTAFHAWINRGVEHAQSLPPK